jgi:hypothetical protein
VGNFIKVRLALLLGFAACGGAAAAPVHCARTVTADVVALDQAMMINRLGASRPGGMIYALRSDVVSGDGSVRITAGNVQLRKGKRPRPLVLRVNAGDCLDIAFQNLLVAPADYSVPANGHESSSASIHVAGLQLVDSAADGGTNAGANPLGPGGAAGGLVRPGGRTTYHLYAPEEGTFLLYSTAGDYNGFSTNQVTTGLFGAVNVQPRDAEWYRSQVTQEDLRLATRGKTPDGHPLIDYEALYPSGHARAGVPVLKMLDHQNRIVHSDLTAIITGARHGRFAAGQPLRPPNPALPDQGAPYREVTVLYHEAPDVVQAFPQFYVAGNDYPKPNLSAGGDTFAINYGSAGIAAEILANRFRLGPGADCPECKFEEFFLSSWVGGDPSMVVDVPANTPCVSTTTPCVPKRASVTYFPDDPSNVYHTYQGDRARFRILHAGASVHHVHHHHAHQWLQTAGSDQSSYLDSQAIGPGASYTLDLVYDGSGNRNLTAGDSIFHCHFYPHFASGMWALFRVHDVLESGTPLDANGRPRSGTRALPDAEIMAGTPIPAVVPLPTRPMAPMPSLVSIRQGQAQLAGGGNPGYPFFVPGRAGHRPPHPPMDFAVDGKEVLDGGLPRHLITAAKIVNQQQSSTDFSKDLGRTEAFELPEEGTPAEQAAMKAHAQQSIASFLPDGTPGRFKMTGLPPAPGAPFANPGMGIDGKVRHYRGANLQVNAVFNKAGWHYPQQRMMALWDDVKPILNGDKPPEPLFFRAHSGDVVEYWHANLIPDYYELDDFQVRTPTDIVGQHIHLVKFDVLASDGAANGFNYEDGSFSPNEVRTRIAGINLAGGLRSYEGSSRRKLTAKGIAALGSGPVPGSSQWLGAQATVQRWWVDPLLDRSGADRTYMTVFTHDHFGPTTHQMTGLYGGLLIEPAGSRWTMPDGEPLNTRTDGGPTSYAANILPAGAQPAYREFALAWGDLQLAYRPGSRSQPDCYPGQTAAANGCRAIAAWESYRGWADPTEALNACPSCPPGTLAPGAIAPALVADFGAGIMSMNYRGEPLPLRLNGGTGTRGAAQDLAHAFSSIPRDTPFGSQPAGGAQLDPNCSGAACLRFPLQPIGAGMLPPDPYTPLLRAYEGDPVQLRLLVGAHTSMHDFTLHGIKWQHAPADPNSGFRNSQFMVLSEHFETLFTLPRTAGAGAADYLYNPSSGYEGLTNGLWGLLRGYKSPAPGLASLPGNAGALAAVPPIAVPAGRTTDCRRAAPCVRELRVSAVTIATLLGKNASLVYNSRGVHLAPGVYDKANPLNDPAAIVYVRDEDLDPGSGRLKEGLAVEPLVLRAAAGDWLRVRLTNRVLGSEAVFTTPESAGRSGVPYSNSYAAVSLLPSSSVGLHPQLLAFDVRAANGVNVGGNPVQTVAPDDASRCGDGPHPCREYLWYAGTLERGADGALVETPVEFGAVNLQPADPLLQAYHGLFGALVVEPLGSSWMEDPGTHTSATVFGADGSVFRDFTLMTQNDTAMNLNGNSLYASGNSLSAFNYRSEPFFYRYGARADPGMDSAARPRDWKALTATDLGSISGISFNAFDTKDSAANRLVGGDPVTPIFRAPAGMPVRFRLLHAPGITDNQQVFELSGHQWQEAPYADGSRRIGPNPASAFTGTTSGFGPTSHFDVVIKHAGGAYRVPGDYLYRSATAAQYQVGLWGLFRVAPPGGGDSFPDTVAMTVAALPAGGYQVNGSTTVRPAAQAAGRVHAPTVVLSSGNAMLANVAVGADGRWTHTGSGDLPVSLRAVSPFGGEATYAQAHEPPVVAAKLRVRLQRAALGLRGSAPK